jgi:hypothetical protein
MRVVKDPSATDRRGNATAVEDDANSFEVSGGAGAATATDAGAGTGSLPLLPAGLFLLACTAGGVLVAVLRPLGHG